MKSVAPKTIYLKDYKPSDYLISHTDLDFDLKENATKTTATLTIAPNKNTENGTPLILDGEGLDLLSIEINNKPLTDNEYSHQDDTLTILNPPEGSFSLKTVAQSNPKNNTSLNGLYLTHDVYCTQCEAEGFRKITFFLDRPDVLSTYRVRVEGDKKTEPILLSNGNLLEQGDVENSDRHFAIWQDPHPKPSYLFALVGGDLDSLSDNYITSDGRDVTLNIYVEKGNAERAEYAMGALKRSFKWDEDEFGCVYDLDIFNIVAVPHFNMGAMENKGLNIFNDRYILADEKTATDADFELIESIVGHEYFHNWTGNRITCRDWFQLCLKEGLTVFRDAEFTSMLRSRPVKRIDDVKTLRRIQFSEDAGPMAHPCRPDSYIEINNFYTATVYRKGAEVVRALHSLVGAKGFRMSMDYYLKQFDGQAATVKDFLYSFEQATGRDLTQFELWYSQAGTPVLRYTTDYSQDNQTYTLTIEQSCEATPGQAVKENYHMPIKLGLLAVDGTDMALVLNGKPVANGMVEITNAKQSFVFENISEKPILSFLRDYSAPVKVDVETNIEEMLFLMANDSDPFNRWQAAQSVAIDNILALMKGSRPDSEILDGRFAKAICKTIKDENLEPAFRQLVMALPPISEIADRVAKDVDHQLIYIAREKLLNHIANENEADMLRLYKQYNEDQTFVPDAKGSGVRAFRNQLLSCLAKSNNQDYIDLAVKHYNAANNMGDMIMGLSIIGEFEGVDNAPFIADFYEKFNQDHLVINKWFTIQALRTAKGTLAKVKMLTEHKDFSYTNPNNVSALIGAFVSSNPLEFHSADGSGYEFIAETIIKLDKINAQVAARLLTPLKNWKSLEVGRKQLAKLALEKIVNVNNLSRDVYEIASKSLVN